jgi:riboflavin kinase
MIMKIENSEIHYTDYSFQKLCEKKYGVNRGVYNAIDQWFYENGIKNINKRRKEILNFLSYTALSIGNSPLSKIKFGNGGLITKLNEFWNQDSFNSKQIYEA